jgi:hypothetical protein
MLRVSPGRNAANVSPPPGFGGADQFPALPAEKKPSKAAPAAAPTGGRSGKKNKQVLLRFG